MAHKELIGLFAGQLLFSYFAPLYVVDKQQQATLSEEWFWFVSCCLPSPLPLLTQDQMFLCSLEQGGSVRKGRRTRNVCEISPESTVILSDPQAGMWEAGHIKVGGKSLMINNSEI